MALFMFCITKIYNRLKINKYVKSIRFDQEMLNYYLLLKKYNIKSTHILRTGFKKEAKIKIEEFEIELKKTKLPF